MPDNILFGRDKELATVDELVDGLPERGSALLIQGAPGIGKSSLLAHAVARAQSSGITVLKASGVQAETHLPFAGLHQLTRTMMDRVSGLPPAQADALRSAFGMAEPSSDTSAPQFFMIALATLSLLGEAAADIPVLLVVDDAQWLDTPTLDVLGFIARRVGAEPLGLLLALREGHTASLATLDIRALHLRPLEPTAADALLDARKPGLGPGVRRRVVDTAAGNPLALIELPIILGAEATSESVASTTLPLTTRLERAFASRLADLPSDTRSALLVTAADDGDALAEVLAAVSTLTGTEISVRSLEPAIAARLVFADEFHIGFTHSLVRSAVLGSATLTDRLAAHGALADILHGQPDRQAWHRAAAIGRPDEAVARELDQVALRARGRGATAVAMTALERATALSEFPEGRAARVLNAAELGLELGKTDHASSLLRQAEPLEFGVRERARLLLLREGLEVEVATSIPRLHLLITTAERVSEAGDPELALRLLRTAARRCWWSDPGRELRERVVAAAERLPVPELHPDLVYTLATATPVERSGTVLDRLERLERQGGYDFLAAATLGTAATTVNAYDHAIGFLQHAAAGLRAQGRLGLLAQTLVSLALSAVHTVDWETGLPAAAEAMRLAEENAQPRWLAGARIAKAQFAALHGDLDTALAVIGEAEGRGLSVANPSGLAFIQITRGLIGLAAGNHAETFHCVWRVFDPADPAYHPFLQTIAIAELAEAATGDDQRAMARAALRQLDATAGSSEAQLTRINLGFAHALLSEDEHAEERFRAAFDLDMSHAPFTRARLMLAHGAWLRRQRRVMEARAPLRIARESFAALGVEPWCERARQELRSAGEGSKRQSRTDWDLLTPQELQIAQLAAEGLSNKEIGQQLYLSPRTIGAHLYRIFPKLAITSRGQLRDKLSAG
ncbi:ATP-binding protein [Streptomyces sp. NBC_01803]|uniref:ATP-binding protein n=1 Tax=Streptomyces sp. NBC_01803 TaxID=2975946 RepID=UPI002DDC03AC|nr:AAA family ATPase [Streptomyces sp. NBC_01803]WSA43632.1 AAA family ATPase [Streptomyces sp. NBC_01803]